MQQIFTVGSLFAGIGGLDYGLERTRRFHVVWQVEIDPYCQCVLAKHWPDVTRYDDVRNVGAYNLASVDLICGGFPCQDISNAGKRAGIEGDRSGLWREFYRIICELRPRYVLHEDVAALIHRGLSAVLADLAACGYDAEWQVLSAQSVGAPHLRERIFIVAYSNHDRCRVREGQQEYQPWRSRTSNTSDDGKKESLAYTTRPRTIETGQTCSGRAELERGCQDVADADRQGLAVGQVFGADARAQLTAFKRNGSARSGQWATEPAICRVVNGIPHRVDRLRGLGNAVVPHIAEYIGHCILAREDHQRDADKSSREL